MNESAPNPIAKVWIHAGPSRVPYRINDCDQCTHDTLEKREENDLNLGVIATCDDHPGQFQHVYADSMPQIGELQRQHPCCYWPAEGEHRLGCAHRLIDEARDTLRSGFDAIENDIAAASAQELDDRIMADIEQRARDNSEIVERLEKETKARAGASDDIATPDMHADWQRAAQNREILEERKKLADAERIGGIASLRREIFCLALLRAHLSTDFVNEGQGIMQDFEKSLEDLDRMGQSPS